MPPESEADELGSCTKDVHAYACYRDGKRFVFVDTPGFNNSSQRQETVLRKIVLWLKATYANPFMPA